VTRTFKDKALVDRKPGSNPNRINDLAKPKDHHKKKREMLEL